MQHIQGQTHDGVADNLSQLQQLFPEAFSEGKVQWEKLQQLMGEDAMADKESYNFTWKGKKDAIKLALARTTGTLRPEKDKSKNWDETENLFIEGDNLEVLRVLQESYRGKIKMIYIDPPYNTGKDFVYKDNFVDNVASYKESSGENLKANPDTSGRYHTNWLNMMYPRLKLAKSLLTDDGVIFISIDDNEVVNLKNICNEIFGEENFITMIGLEITKTQGMKVKSAKEGSIVKNYEYILTYSKSGGKIVENVMYDYNPGWDNHYNTFLNIDGDIINKTSLTEVMFKDPNINGELKKYQMIKNGKFSLKDMDKATMLSKVVYDWIYKENSCNIYQEMACSISLDNEFMEQLRDGKIIRYDKYILTLSSGGKIRQYGSLDKALHHSDDYKSKFGTCTIRGNLRKGFYSDMMNVAKEGGIEYKNGKKPVRLMNQLARLIGVADGDIVLDFFAGSASTAHAIMDLNVSDDGSRKYIMIQVPEVISEKEDAYKDGFRKITEISSERIRRAGEKIKEEHPDADVDVGFKYFSLDSTNLKKRDENPDDISQSLLDYADPLISDRSQDDLLYEVMLKLGYKLSDPVKESEILGKKVYDVAHGHMFVCMEKDLSAEFISELRKSISSEATEPTVVLYDEGFADDVAKLNAIKQLEEAGTRVMVL